MTRKRPGTSLQTQLCSPVGRVGQLEACTQPGVRLSGPQMCELLNGKLQGTPCPLLQPFAAQLAHV